MTLKKDDIVFKANACGLTLVIYDGGGHASDIVNETMHVLYATNIESLEVHPVYRPSVLDIAREHFEGEYGPRYRDRENWRRVFGAYDREESPAPPLIPPMPSEIPAFLRGA